MARSIIGSLWNPAQRNELNRMLEELYNDLGKATNTEKVLNDFLNGSGVVTSTMIGTGQVTTVNIGAHAVNGFKIAEDTITEPKYKSGSVSTRALQDGSVTNEKLETLPFVRETIADKTKLSDVIKNGRYLGLRTSSHEDLPASFINESFMLDVQTYNNNEFFVIQTLTSTADIKKTYKRYIQSGGSSARVGEWEKDSSLMEHNNEGSNGHPLNGKNVVCFGDSLTEFGDYTGKIAQETGATVVNVGFGGCRMAKSPEGSNRFIYNEMSMAGISETLNSGDFTALENAAEVLKNDHNDDNTAAVTRFKNTDFNQVDYITIFYGTNDWNGGIPLGSIDSQDVFEFNGAINKSIENILTKYPHIRILLLTPTWRARKDVGDGLETDVNPNSNGVYMIEYVDAIEERAKAHKTPSYNLYNNSGINKYTSEHYQRDGLHLTDKGDELISRIISHELSGM